MDDTLDYYYGPLPNNTSLIDKYNIKYINDNKVILLYPNMYDLESDLKFNRNDKLLEVLEKNDKYNEINSLWNGNNKKGLQHLYFKSRKSDSNRRPLHYE